MSHLGGQWLTGRPRGGKRSRYRPWVFLAVPLAAILFQVYVPLFFEFSSYLALPLLVTVYFAVMRRSPIHGIFIGAGIGLVQDSLSHQPLGMFGIAKTLAGYAAAAVGVRFDAGPPAVRFVLGFLFFVFHELCYWVLNWTLLGQKIDPGVSRTLLAGLVNGAAAVLLFSVLDKLKESGETISTQW